MAKKKPVVVTITEGKHKTQPWSVRIEQGKTDTILSQRYTRLHSAKMGALRKLKAKTELGNSVNILLRPMQSAWYVEGRPIQFVVKPKTTKS